MNFFLFNEHLFTISKEVTHINVTIFQQNSMCQLVYNVDSNLMYKSCQLSVYIIIQI